MKNIVLVIAGIVILLTVVILFGMQFLIGFSLSLEKARDQNTNNAASEDQTFLAPPSLNATADATNSATTTISGYAQPKQSVALYVNGKLVDKNTVDKDRSFTFTDVKLNSGENDIKAKVIGDNNKESEYSNIINISYNNKAPSLDVSSPQDGQSFSKDTNTITVSGKTDPNAQVTVNELWAIVDDSGNFSYDFRLQNGDNTIKIEAIDDAGNKTTKEIKVKKSE